MALSGGLSNTSIQGLLQCLTEHPQDQAPRPRRLRAGWSDGRREFGTVDDAVVAVLNARGTEMRARDIHTAVEELLGERVSRYSVADSLRRKSRGRRQLFVRAGYSVYALAPPREAHARGAIPPD